MKKFLVLFSLVFMVLLVGCEKNGKQVNDEIETMAAQSVSSVLVMDSYEEALRLNSNEQQAAISALEKAQVMLGNKLEIKKEKSDKNEYSSMYQIIYNDSVFKMYVTDTKEKVESEIDEEEVTLYMVNPKAPCFIKDDDGTFIYLILPVNFSNVN